MVGEHMQPLVSFIGIVLQFAASLLLAMMFLLLRPYARRRHYFATWSAAWVVLTIAIASLAVRYLLDGDMVFSAQDEQTSGTRFIYWLYLFAKCVFVALLVAGANQFAQGTAQRQWLMLALPVVLLYTLIAMSRSENLFDIVRWQAPLAIAGFGWCAVRMGGLPPSRHGIGTHLAGSVFSLMSLLWVIYLFAFGARPRSWGGGTPLVLESLVRFNSFIDVLLHVLLGFGMVLLLMEQAKREVDDANAELAVAHSAMRRAALYDSLTGCLNRRAYDEGVGLENARGGFGAVMMFDLDDLKDVNDTYGHSAGDTLLRHLTDSLRAELRPSDKLYRWGGDEFMMLLPGADEARARSRLRAVLNDVAVLRLGPNDEAVRLNVSMGSAAYASAEQISSAIDAADAMMYREKTRKKTVRTV